MRAKVVSVAIDPAAPLHGTLAGTGQWQLSIKTGAHVLTRSLVRTTREMGEIIKKKKTAPVTQREASYAASQLARYN